MNHFPEKFLPFLDKIVIVSLFVFTAFSMFSISITQIAGGLGGLAWLLRTHITGSWQEQRWPLGIPFALFVLACLMAVVTAYEPAASYKELKKLLEILIFFWVVNCVRENSLRDSLSTLLIITATFAGLYGFYQGWESGVSTAHRVEGTMSVYMTFAGLLMIIGLVAVGRVLFKRPRENWLWLVVIIITTCLLFTMTRQAWLGFIIGLFFFVYIWDKKYFLVSFGIVTALVVLTIGPMKQQALSMLAQQDQTFIGQMKFRVYTMISGEDSTYKMRKALWRVGVEIAKDHPLTGCGYHCVDLINARYPDPTGIVNRLRGMHNNFVQLAVDTGLLGLSSWVGIWICFFVLLYRRSKVEDSESSSKWVIYGSAAAGLAFLTGGCFESNLYDSEVVMVLYFVMALPFAGSQAKIS
jgi:O-antigen ligase